MVLFVRLAFVGIVFTQRVLTLLFTNSLCWQNLHNTR